MEPALALITYPELEAWGYTRPTVQDALATGLLTRLRHGIYVETDAWQGVFPEARIITRAHALARVSAMRPVFSHTTAAALHGQPLHSPDDHRVHVIAPDERPGAAAGVVRHRGELTTSDVVEVDGLRCTSLARTVADIARTATFEQAVTVTDAALRRTCTPSLHDYSTEAAAMFRDEVWGIARLSAHGRSQAERVIRFADGRAQLPGESVSRIRLAELGFARPRLQVAVPGPDGRGLYFVDFGLDDVHAFGEFDGQASTSTACCSDRAPSTACSARRSSVRTGSAA